jgi:hypothetical protein
MGEDWADSTTGRRLTLRQDPGLEMGSHGPTAKAREAKAVWEEKV